MGRYESDGTITTVATSGRVHDRIPVGDRWTLEGKNVSTIVAKTGRPARVDSYVDASGPVGVTALEEQIGSGVGAPIIVEGHLWGVMATYSLLEQPLPANTEARLANFTEVVATAIANAESRADLARLAEEQAALRRVATLVALGTPPADVFAAVTEEVGLLLRVEDTTMCRYEANGTATVVASWGELDTAFIPVGARLTVEGDNVTERVLRTGRPARIDDYANVTGSLGDYAREVGLQSMVGCPIVVEGHLWGVMMAATRQAAPLAAGTESRIREFTELLATAIANTESRADLAASRARVVAAADETRRRIERDLHDGIQQRLVALGLELRGAQAGVPLQFGELEGVLSRIADELASVFDELREISRGIHPAILSEGGLKPALGALCRRSALPVELDLHAEERLPERVEVAAYYVVSEALTNAAKHAHASVVKVKVGTGRGALRLVIRDDGMGGADLGQGSGLVGLSDRIEALGGTFRVISPFGKGTTLLVEVPLEGHSSALSPEP
jgi:signal transduction histidine kinase